MKIGEEKNVQYFCYKNPKIESTEEDSYTVLNVNVSSGSSNIVGEGLTFSKNNNNWYRIELKNGVTTGGTITVTENGSEYTMKYTVGLPYIGAYTSTNFDKDNLVPGWELSYDNLGEEDTTTKNKTIYFYIQTGEGETVTDMSLTNSNGNLVSGNFVSDPENEKEYLKVTVSENVLDASASSRYQF